MSFNKGMEGAGKAEGIPHKSQFNHYFVSELQANSLENNRNCGYQSRVTQDTPSWTVSFLPRQLSIAGVSSLQPLPSARPHLQSKKGSLKDKS